METEIRRIETITRPDGSTLTCATLACNRFVPVTELLESLESENANSERMATQSQAVITGIIQQVGHQDLNELRTSDLSGVPVRERRFHPYKIWVDEVRLQLAQFSPKSQGRAERNERSEKKRGKGVDQISSNQPLPGQMTLFD